MKKSIPFLVALATLYFFKDSLSTLFLVFKPLLIPIINVLNDQSFVFLTSFTLFIASIFASFLFYKNYVLPLIQKQRHLQSGIKSLPHAELSKDKTVIEAIDNLLVLFQKEGLYISALEEWNDDRLARNRFPSTPFKDYADKSREERGLSQTESYDALPAYFTTIGLILTFVGLVAALYFAAAGFKSGNYEEAKAAIIQLLNASAFKFLTSVAALIGSFIISIALRFGYSKLEEERSITLSMIEAYLALWKKKSNITKNADYNSLENALNNLNETIKTHFKVLN